MFVASLGYFAFAYLIIFGNPAAGQLNAGDLAWNAVLLATFGFHHSVFARLPVRRWVTRYVSPELERSAYVWTASLLLIAVCALWRPLPGVAWEVEGWLAWCFFGGQVVGAFLVLGAAVQIDTFKLAGLHPSPPPVHGTPVTFTTQGLYGRVRHPIYLGWCLTVNLILPMTTTRLVFAALSGLYILIAIPLEERTLRAVDSSGYDAYSRKVRWRLVPGLY